MEEEGWGDLFDEVRTWSSNIECRILQISKAHKGQWGTRLQECIRSWVKAQ